MLRGAPRALGWAAARARAPRARMVDDMNWLFSGALGICQLQLLFPRCDCGSDVMSQIIEAHRLSSSDGRRTAF